MRCQYQKPNNISTSLTINMTRQDVKPDPMANVTLKDRKGSAKRRAGSLTIIISQTAELHCTPAQPQRNSLKVFANQPAAI